MKGRVTFTALMIPHEDLAMFSWWFSAVHLAFGIFVPRGCEVITSRHPFPRIRHPAAWFRVAAEDTWVDITFGKLEQKLGESNDRTIFCEFRNWAGVYNATPELEEVSANDPLARSLGLGLWRRRCLRLRPGNRSTGI
ncbi:hypothetical protein F5Y14DRAFT_418624 [Nemania sp. NC0429]|nr:hypothetical protein F5Y14DRAFT_418624 [Nemania sp. NC0429]